MRLCDRHVFRELLVPFLIGTLAVLLLVTTLNLSNDLQPILQQKLPAATVARNLATQLPLYLVLALPVSTALAASLATNRMTRDNEITVTRSAGVPLARTFLPIFVFGILTSAANLYISERVVPWAAKEQRRLSGFLNEDGAQGGGAMTVRVEGVTVSYISSTRLTAGRRRFNRVLFIERATKQNPAPRITTAEWADYEQGIWELHGVVDHVYNKKGTVTTEERKQDGKKTLAVDFSAMYQPLAGRYDTYSFEELTRRAKEARRLGNFQEATTLEVERWFKLSLPTMGFVFALFGPPLALRFARTGAFTGVLLSIVTVFVAWNTLLLMKSVGIGGYLSPPVAAWSTNALFTVLGLWLLRAQE
jgi:lipopolysaccharide export system permease protein